MAARVEVSLDNAFDLARSALAASSAQAGAQHELEVIETAYGELWWAWVVPCQSADYCRARGQEPGWMLAPRFLVGLGPCLVDKFTGEVIMTGSGSRLHSIERKRGYRPWWKFWGPNSLLKLSFVERVVPSASPSR
jgi:hypothetical protein